MTFNKDFLIDLIGYRRFGHNEMDEPSATQPMLYDAVRKHPTVKNIFAEKLIHNGIDRIMKPSTKSGTLSMKRLEEAYRKVPAKKEDMTHEIVLPEPVSNGFPDVDTSVDVETLRKINQELVSWPENFNVFDKLKRILERRAKAFDDDRKVRLAACRAMAFASILKDGTPLRLTGQIQNAAHSHTATLSFTTARQGTNSSHCITLQIRKRHLRFTTARFLKDPSLALNMDITCLRRKRW
jgi:2-oxoglutarate dehydrogenase E1 component